MMDPGMMGAPLPPEAAPAPAPKAIEMVMAALGAWKQERDMEQDVVLAAVAKATGGMPSGLMGATEGAAFATPAGPEMGAY
jgi:hypothetical protein